MAGRLCAVLLLAIPFLGGCTTADSIGPASDQWELLFEDDFRTESWLDRSWLWFTHPADWSAYDNAYGAGNDESACLRPENLTAGADGLVITARSDSVICATGEARDYTSGFLGGREADRLWPVEARFEIRARVPQGQGLWPAFWLRHRDGAQRAEVDVFEVFHAQYPDSVVQTLHLPGQVRRSHVVRTGGPDEWHVYGAQVTADDAGRAMFRWFVDGRETFSTTSSESVAALGGSDPEQTWDMAINLAVGGRWTGDPQGPVGYLAGPGVCAQTYQPPPGGDPEQCPTAQIRPSEFPAEMNVDWVRVYIPD